MISYFGGFICAKTGIGIRFECFNDMFGGTVNKPCNDLKSRCIIIFRFEKS